MIKVSVLYPNKPGARFDHAYYSDKHMPMVKECMGKFLKSYAVDKGLAGGLRGEPSVYLAAGHLICESMEDFKAGFGPHLQKIMADIPNYTDAAPIVQVNEIVVG